MTSLKKSQMEKNHI